jgi:hypothetical protein
MPGIAPVVTKRRLHDTHDHAASWRTVPPADRVAMVQQLRAEFHGWDDGVGPRLQRVHRVLRRA